MQTVLRVRLLSPLPLHVEFRSVGRFALQIRQMTAGDLRWRLYAVSPDRLTEILMTEGFRSIEELNASLWGGGVEVTIPTIAATYWGRLVADGHAEKVEA
jgi:hypothetical protein